MWLSCCSTRKCEFRLLRLLLVRVLTFSPDLTPTLLNSFIAGEYAFFSGEKEYQTFLSIISKTGGPSHSSSCTFPELTPPTRHRSLRLPRLVSTSPLLPRGLQNALRRIEPLVIPYVSLSPFPPRFPPSPLTLQTRPVNPPPPPPNSTPASPSSSPPSVPLPTLSTLSLSHLFLLRTHPKSSGGEEGESSDGRARRGRSVMLCR